MYGLLGQDLFKTEASRLDQEPGAGGRPVQANEEHGLEVASDAGLAPD